MKNRFFPFICYLIPVLFLISCGQPKEPEFKGIENIRVSRLGLKESTLTLDLHYFNPNPSSMKLKKAEGDAWIENSFLGHFTIDTLIHIPANADFRLPVKLHVDMGRIIQNSLVSYLIKEVTIKVEGRARVGKGFIYINYPLRYEGKHNLAELLK